MDPARIMFNPNQKPLSSAKAERLLIRVRNSLCRYMEDYDTENQYIHPAIKPHRQVVNPLPQILNPQLEAPTLDSKP